VDNPLPYSVFSRVRGQSAPLFADSPGVGIEHSRTLVSSCGFSFLTGGQSAPRPRTVRSTFFEPCPELV
jgi:hypothetical protein